MPSPFIRVDGSGEYIPRDDAIIDGISKILSCEIISLPHAVYRKKIGEEYKEYELPSSHLYRKICDSIVSLNIHDDFSMKVRRALLRSLTIQNRSLKTKIRKLLHGTDKLPMLQGKPPEEPVNGDDREFYEAKIKVCKEEKAHKTKEVFSIKMIYEYLKRYKPHVHIIYNWPKAPKVYAMSNGEGKIQISTYQEYIPPDKNGEHKHFIDLFISYNKGTIACLEIDENAHGGYDELVEKRRMTRIYNHIKEHYDMASVHFVRFNPDDSVIFTTNTNSTLQIRDISLLFRRIDLLWDELSRGKIYIQNGYFITYINFPDCKLQSPDRELQSPDRELRSPGKRKIHRMIVHI